VPGIDLADSTLLATTGEGSINALALAKSAYADMTEPAYPVAYTSYLDGSSVKAHEIVDIDTWRMVPGDTVVALCSNVLITLEGDNLVAALEMTDANGDVIDFSEDNNELNGVVVGAEIYANGEIAEVGDNGELGYFAAPNSDDSQDDGVEHEGNGAVEIYALQTTGAVATSDANAADLRLETPEAGSGRMSLGQGYATAMFVVHFIDDGIEGATSWTTTYTCTGEGADWTGEDHSIADNCSGTWDAVTTADDGYYPDTGSDTNPGGNGDASDVAHNRYLATEELAKISDGRLVLKQIRWDAGQYTTASVSPSPTETETEPEPEPEP